MQPALEADDLGDQRRQLGDADILAPADIDVAFVGIALHQEDEPVGKIVDMEEFALRLARAPDLDLGRIRDLGLVRLRQQRRDDMARLQIKSIARSVEIGRLG